MLAVIVATAIRPDKVFDWFLENATVAVFLIVLTVSYKRLALSDTSYLLTLAFLSLHEWGAHFKYYDDPIGEWMKALFGSQRNPFDRVVHFSYGFFMSYPLQEWTMRVARVRNRARYVIPVAAILAFSALYEMLEAFAASVLSPERGEEFVGMQGDMWDSQKDMCMAGLGAIAAMLIIAAVRHHAAKARVHSLAIQEPICVEETVS